MSAPAGILKTDPQCRSRAGAPLSAGSTQAPVCIPVSVTDDVKLKDATTTTSDKALARGYGEPLLGDTIWTSRFTAWEPMQNQAPAKSDVQIRVEKIEQVLSTSDNEEVAGLKFKFTSSVYCETISLYPGGVGSLILKPHNWGPKSE